jgi:hypothetical protein
MVHDITDRKKTEERLQVNHRNASLPNAEATVLLLGFVAITQGRYMKEKYRKWIMKRNLNGMSDGEMSGEVAGANFPI